PNFRRFAKRTVATMPFIRRIHVLPTSFGINMRKYSALLLILAIVVLPIRESSAQDDDTRIGIGVGFTSGIFGGGLDFVESLFSPASIYVPITFESFRLEPQFGIA